MRIIKTPGLLFIVVLILNSCGKERTPTDDEDGNATKENFHLYLLMGQSNMAGRGKVESIDTLTHPRVFMLDRDTTWVLARDPIHFDKPIAGTGLGLTFGKIMANRNNSIRVGLIPCAKGGSSINQWFGDSLHQATNSFPYNEMIAKAKKAMKEGTLKGILWHQGESDTGTEGSVDRYSKNFNAMLNSLKADLEIETVPIVIGELGYFFYQKARLAEDLNKVLSEISDESDCIGLVSAEKLHDKGDSTHFDSNSYRELGTRYANKMIEIQSLCATILNDDK
jgi:hypothetical protein